jgi:hypothetical protein
MNGFQHEQPDYWLTFGRCLRLTACSLCHYCFVACRLLAWHSPLHSVSVDSWTLPTDCTGGF